MDFRSLHYIRGIPAKPMRAWDYDLTCKVHIHTYIVRACQEKKRSCCFFVSYFQGKYAKKAVPFFTQKRQYLWRRRRPKRRHLERRSPFRVYTHWYQPWVVTHEKDIVKNCPGRAIKFIGYEMAGVVRVHAFIKVRRTHALKKLVFLKSPLKNPFRGFTVRKPSFSWASEFRNGLGLLCSRLTMGLGGPIAKQGFCIEMKADRAISMV